MTCDECKRLRDLLAEGEASGAARVGELEEVIAWIGARYALNGAPEWVTKHLKPDQKTT